MKVLHCIHSLDGGGAEAQVRLLCEGLKEYGVQSHLACVNPNATLNIDMPLDVVPRASKYDYKIIKKLSWIVDKEKPDIIHAWLPAAITIPSMIIGRRKRIPVVFSYRNKMFFHRPISYPEYLTALFCSNKIISNNPIIQSNILYKWLYRLKNGLTIYNAVIPSFHTHEDCKKKSKYRFLFIGRLTPQKNLVFLINALTKYKDYDNWHLDIFGNGELRIELENLVDKLNLTDLISFRGFAVNPRKEMLDADLLIFPSLYEGMPNVLVEAFSVGMPIIASDIVAIREIVQDKDCVHWFSPLDENSIRHSIEIFMSNPESFNILARNGLELSKKFTINAMALQYSKAYRSLL